ncbi:bacteriocin immunity protein [Pseudolactococcus reticulitermitis]|uniref:Uncharacterized protein n=1 Tax=Pseudolactococcus reticulitermitis TaxID=2025039 RepID=A0A224XCG5_9LACT|nr:bacteriocin immunity protein [Lactococcus reticulitermitis]GAX47365.1 hypothetical protein RsY01_965 [Lactococcus reticulitermitis]
MGVTARQTKFIFRTKELLSLSSSVSVKEREILTRAAIAFNEGVAFKKVINVLSLGLRDLEIYQQNGLTPNADKLFKDIQEIYGEPVDFLGARDWKYDNPDFEWVGNGRYGGKWRRKGDVYCNSFRSQFISVILFIAILICVVLLLFFLPKFL